MYMQLLTTWFHYSINIITNIDILQYKIDVDQIHISLVSPIIKKSCW